MCLAAPARVISVSDKAAVVDYQGAKTTARLDTLGEPVAVGDYVLVHTGFAIRRLTAEDAEETLRLFDELSQSLAAEGPRPSLYQLSFGLPLTCRPSCLYLVRRDHLVTTYFALLSAFSSTLCGPLRT